MRRSVVLISVLVMILAVLSATPILAADSLSVTAVSDRRVVLSATAGIEKVKYFTLDSPERLVVDLYGVVPGDHASTIKLTDGFKQLRVGPLDNKTRFVFDVAGPVFPTFNVDANSDKVVVTWQGGEDIAANVIAEPAISGSAKIVSIDFSSADGRSKLNIALAGSATATPMERSGNVVQFSLQNTSLPQTLRREFDTLSFPSAIFSATPYLVNDGGKPEVRFVVKLKGAVPYHLNQTPSGYEFSVEDGSYAFSAQPATGILPVPAKGTSGVSMSDSHGFANKPSDESDAKVMTPIIEQIGAPPKRQYTGEKTSLVFDNADVRDILRLIAEISELNIIASDEVSGTITLRLIDVPWDQALDLVLEVSGLGMLQEGNVVRVLPKDKIRAMREAELTAQRSQEKLETLLTEVVTISYADLKSVAKPARDLLSDRGKITEDKRNKLLIISDVAQRIQKIKDLISILDTPERQVMIEARIVQVSSNYSKSLGVNWAVFGKDGSGDFSSLSGGGGGFLVDIFDDEKGTLLASPGFNSTMQIGNILDNVLLDLQISALESDGKGKVISTPRVTTLNGETAKISQGTTIPYQSRDDKGIKTEFVSAELSLEVTPVINPDDSIILEILATNDSPSLTDGATAPSIDTKQAKTKVLIKDGETTVVGGIYVENSSDADNGMPWLMNIPIIGHLFKSSIVSTTKDELLVFITPRIVRNN